ncbi:transposase [Couchioplanes caeruleus]|uniref:transposase n=1 Tax=Couchioplanes caeruleus TaxID=56438 RepID=UPI000B27B96B
MHASHPTVRKVWVDGGYQTTVWRRGARHGIDVERVTRRPAERGFRASPRRWVVERTFGWLMQHRRLALDYESPPQGSRAMILWAMANTMSRRPAGESTQTWRD